MGRRGERGLALVVVLVVLALLLTVAGEFAVSMRVEGTTALHFRHAVSAAYLAEAGYYRAVAELLAPFTAHHLDASGTLVFRRPGESTPTAPARENLPLGAGRFSYRISDELARINLNRATPERLHRLLAELGVERATRDVVVDSILDWLDANEEHHLNGAESDYYLGLATPYRSKNGEFDDVEELAQVKGVTAGLLAGGETGPGLLDLLRVVGDERVNLNTASAVVLRALGFAEAEVEACTGLRPFASDGTVPAPCKKPGVGVPAPTQPLFFRIEASGEVPGQGRRTLLAVVERRIGRDGVAQVLPRRWRWLSEEGPRR